MIRNSYVFLEGIGLSKERNIWEQGITSWNDFINTNNIKGISTWRKKNYNRSLKKAGKALHSQNSNYFTNKLPSVETWRLYDFFKEDAVFLDIETSGLYSYDKITVIGLFDGLNTKTMIRGINLDLNHLKNELKKYKLIVTFNGASFDLPFIRKRYPDILPNIPNFDLRHACSKIGLTGGLKNIEKELDIKRNKIVKDMCGGDAAKLWRMYRGSGDDYYLKLLVEYNEEDIINLKKIANFVYDKLETKNL